MKKRSEKSLIRTFTFTLWVAASCFALAVVTIPYVSPTKNIPYAAIRFSPASSVLSESDKLQLRQLSENAREKYQFETAIIAAWSDREIPLTGPNFSKSDHELANLRVEVIKFFMQEELGLQSLESYNMAETSNWLAKLIYTKDSEMKSQYSKKGAEDPVNPIEANIIRNEGGPGKVVIVIENR